jgi:type II secretory pathway pseudopilin PulG
MKSSRKTYELKRSGESGYSLIEGLVAVLIVSFLASAVAPMIAWTVGTRAQAKRIELATQAARSYIDAVKSGVIDHNGDEADDTDFPVISGTLPQDVAAPTDENSMYCVNFDDEAGCQINSLTDMYVQGIGYNPSSTDPEDGYCLLVRVYRAKSFDGVTLETPPTQSNSMITNAVGSLSLPMVQVKTEVLPRNTSYRTLEQRIGGSVSDPNSNEISCGQS